MINSQRNERENVQNLQSEYHRKQEKINSGDEDARERGEQKRKEKESKELIHGGYVEK